MYFIITIAAIILILFLSFIVSYNGLVKKKTMVEEAWSGISVQLKRRHDLIPNLVNTVKGYATHEEHVFEEVTRARSTSMGVSNIKDATQAENTLTGTLKSLFAVAEAYPDLKANTNFLQLQDKLNSIEDDIQMARRYYNGSARNLNIAVQAFPSNIVASIFKFEKFDYFELEAETDKDVPQVSF